MSDETALLAAVAAVPASDLPRLVYADWLDDHGRTAEAELLRLEVALAANRGTAADRGWFRALAAARDPAWLGQVVRPEVGRCGLRFRFACPKRWADLTPTTDPAQRHCEACHRPVHLCTDRAAAVGWAMAGECVAIDRRLVNPADVPQGIETVVSGMIDFEYRPPERLPRPEEPVGVELRYVAVPPAWGLVEQARGDRERGENLSMLDVWARHPEASDRDEYRDDPYWQAARRLPADRVYDLDRRFDFLHWLLSATRRDDPPEPTDAVLDRLFSTGTRIADHVRACQGWPVVHVPAAVVRDAATALAGVTAADLARRFDPNRADRAGIYKYSASHDADADWLATAQQQLAELTAFVTAAAGRGDELIVIVD